MRRFLARLLRLGLFSLRKMNTFVASLESRLDSGEDLELHRRRVIRSTQRHDMARHPDEEYYARQYWGWISDHLDSAGTRRNARYLDLGCGQGRLSLKLAQWCAGDGGRVIGVDLSETAVAQARTYAAEAGLANVEYVAEDAATFVRSRADGEFEVVLLTEVVFFHPDFTRLLQETLRVLRPGRLLFVSFRPQYFHALSLVTSRMWQDCGRIVNERAGRILGGESYQTWQTSAEVRQMLEGQYGLELLALVAIGACSGIPGDPHAFLAKPSKLAAEEQENLMMLERSIAPSVPDAGRYMLAVARRRV